MNTTARAVLRAALDHYHYQDDTDAHTRLVDLLTDLRHYAASTGLDFADADWMASEHFRAETDRED